MLQRSVLITALFLFAGTIRAGYITINSSDSSYYHSSTTGSIPYTSSGFYYADPQGNSVGYREIRHFPVIVNQYNNAIWVEVNNGPIPGNAIVLQYINGYPVFYCRVQSGNALFYGRLVPNQGCYLDQSPDRPLTTYQVLVR